MGTNRRGGWLLMAALGAAVGSMGGVMTAGATTGVTAGVTAGVSAGVSAGMAPEPADAHIWLEEVMGEKALDWVRQRNAVSEAQLQAQPGFADIRRELREVLDSRDRIPGVSRRGSWLYNFWQDSANPRGVWRRTTLAEYRKEQPAWEVLIDLDALGRSEGRSWVWGGSQCLPGADDTRCLITLSPGGSDAAEVREFDLGSRRFVTDGFFLPQAKSRVTWVDRDTLLVATDTGAGSLTDSGYPRVARLWKRGTPLAASTPVLEGRQQDVSVFVGSDHTPGHKRVMVSRSVDFWRTEMHLLEWPSADPSAAPTLRRIAKPDDAQLTFWKDRALMRLRADWTHAGKTWPAGSLLVMPAATLLEGKPDPVALFTPTARRSLSSFALTHSSIVLNVLEDVTGRLEVRRWDGLQWTTRPIPVAQTGTVSVASLHDPMLGEKDEHAEGLLVQYTDLLTPESLLLARADRGGLEALKARSGQFDAKGMRLEQRFAVSKDGTRVPYFIVWPRSVKPGQTLPTLLYGYGGFDISMRSTYSGGIGRAWLARGGVYVLANIRGGGEYGPTWHRSALLQNKQRSYDDFIAIAEDLIKTGVTTPAQLGIRGGSNGGLLVGAVMVQRPDLFNAVVCQVPLLDMRRYHRLLAGASWMAEYGNPDRVEDWGWISRYSPYHNIPAAQGEGAKKLPATLLVTSTKDDRVHPGHARKMAARLAEVGQPVLYWENIEGGHGGAADNGQRAQMQALEYAFLWKQLGGAPK